jgi:hypothetical protein
VGKSNDHQCSDFGSPARQCIAEAGVMVGFHEEH